MKDPYDYAGQEICPRCGSGWPVCAPLPAGTPKWVRAAAHAVSCDRYVWADALCDDCEAVYADEGQAVSP